MTASNVKTALQTAGLTVEQFAEILEVDPKTVRRWAAGRLPYPRHRAAIARALDTTEHALWPDDVPAPPPAATDVQPTATAPRLTVDGASARSSERDRPVCEVTASWESPGADGAPTVLGFLAHARRRVELLGGGGGMASSPGVMRSLTRCAANGAEIRMVAEAGTPELAALADHPTIEIRLIDQRFMHGVVRADDRLLLAIWLAGNSPTPVMLLERQVNGGVFDRVITHFDTIWQAAAPLPAGADERPGDAQPSDEPEGPSPARHWPRQPG